MALNPKLQAGAEARSTFLSMQQADPSITEMVSWTKLVVLYLLQQDGDSPGWRISGIEGSLFMVARNCEPKYRLIIKNDKGTSDLVDDFHPDWEVDAKQSYIFYKVEQTAKRIRGLWFHDDAERMKLEEDIDKILGWIRPEGHVPLCLRDGEVAPPTAKDGSGSGGDDVRNKLQSMGKAGGGMPTDQVVQTNANVLRASLHSLVDEDAFLEMVYSQLKGAGGTVAKGGGNQLSDGIKKR